MPLRFIFRSTYFENIAVYAQDRCIRSKNCPPTQIGHRISYSGIVSRRGDIYTTPDDNSVNDFVPFYFSPVQAMSYTISQGNVDLKSPHGEILRKARLDDLAIMVAPVNVVIERYSETHFISDSACNSSALVNFGRGKEDLNTLINWEVFDDPPYIANIPEIGYEGVCKYFNDRDEAKYSHRKSQRMAEFLVKDQFDFELIGCIIVFNDDAKQKVESLLHSYQIPVYKKDKYF
ncbi:MAG: DUF4433 domain-containing protein [Burkholderiales bacterium]|jgi:hypothetical protein|nr:DUF4433 domain-containing protein [Burkholderiales bacterium]